MIQKQYIFFAGKKVLNLSYEDKLQLIAYYKQISCGSYDNSKMPETGYFDVVGNDRRYIFNFLVMTSNEYCLFSYRA